MSKKQYKRRIKRIIHLRYIERKLLKRKSKKKSLSKNNKKASSEFKSIYTSKVLNILNNANFAKKIKVRHSEVELKVPEIFCFSKRPDETIAFLQELYGYLINPRIQHIHFDHFTCKYLNVCASTAMDIILLEALQWRKSMGYDIRISGTIQNGKLSNSEEVDSLLKISGIIKHLNIQNTSIPANYENLELIECGESSDVAEKTIKYMNNSLRRHGFKLTKLGNNYFGSFLGEIVDNCKNHSGNDGVWYTLGHYYYDEKTQVGKCKLTIFDFGQTIYEGLKNTPSKRALSKIKHYIKKTILFSKKSEETYYTLFSLQQRVSRIVSKDIIRGNGTVTFIENLLNLFNSDIENHKSVFSITSGRCSILFDGTYKLEKKAFQSGYTNKTIAFNKNNNLYEEPDAKYVRTMANYFPGTVISMDLTIDNKYLTRGKL